MPQSCPRCHGCRLGTLLYDPRSQLPTYRCRACGNIWSHFDPETALRLLRALAPDLLRSACRETTAA